MVKKATAKPEIRTFTCAELLWGQLAKPSYLWLGCALLLFMMLGGRELWTQEHRWADIVSGMFYRHDFLHPYLGLNNYYDKPLLSYWLISLIALITQQLNTWVIRLPSALAGFLAVWAIYRLGWRLKNKSFGLLCGWLLLTTFYFIFWSRVSSADMLNLAGSLLAVTWYFEKRDTVKVLNYLIFFVILAVTSLCKGLGGAVVALLAIFPDLMYQHNWKKHVRWSLLWSAVPAIIIYIVPFWLSAHIGGEHYTQDGLYLVYRENILRYFKPFDHKDPIYTYFIFLPIYLLPWTLFFIPALLSLPKRWRSLEWNSKWMIWALFVLFTFFTASGSRRSYYVLPIIPYAILVTADRLNMWMQAQTSRSLWMGRAVVAFFFIFLLFFGFLQPFYYRQGGQQAFAKQLQIEASRIQPWKNWQFVLLDPESKVVFYLHLPPQVASFDKLGERKPREAAALLKLWPLLQEKPKNVIFISRKYYAATLQSLLPHYQLVVAPPTLAEQFFHREDPNASIAFIPSAR